MNFLFTNQVPRAAPPYFRNMNKAHSDFIFSLIDEFQILSASGSANDWTDQDLHLFTIKYQEQALQRDAALSQYLLSTREKFRCHLPYSKWTLAVAGNVIWYYDELVVTDPILDILGHPSPNSESQKYRLQEALQYISEFKDAIIGGYLLFAGGNLLPTKTGRFEAESNLLMSDEQVLSGFEAYTRMLKKPNKLNDDERDNMLQLMVDYNGMWGENKSMGMYIPPHVFNSGKLNNGIMYDLMGSFYCTTKQEIISLGKGDMLETMKHEYAKDINLVLEAVANAQRFNIPVLFYRDVDGTVASRYSWLTSGKQQAVDTTVYDFTAPYLQDIPPERLFETRMEIPQAFNDFRFFLHDLVTKTMKATDNPDEIRYRINHEVRTMQNKLQVEIKNAERKMKIHGVAAPIVAALGSLGLMTTGVDYSKLISILLSTGGGIKTLTTIYDVMSDKEKAALNPTYFMWRAQAKQNN